MAMLERARRRPSSSLVGLLMLGATGLTAVGLSGCEKAAAATNDTAQPVDAVKVETVAAASKAMPRVIRLSGSVVGLKQTNLAANASGRILEVAVDRGTEVKKGDILAKLDTRGAALGAQEAQANLMALEARQKQSAIDCERAAQLYASGAISKADFDRTDLACKTSPLERQATIARVSLASLNVTDGTIRAPFAGYITERRVHEGEYLRPDSTVVSIVDLDTLRLEVAVPEVYLAALHPGASLGFSVPAFKERTFSAKIRANAGTVRPGTRDIVCDADVENADHALLPGMFASVLVPLAPADAIAIPSSTVFEKNGGPHVFTLVDGRLEEHVVELGEREGDLVAIARGLHAGDLVVKAPTPEMKNGQPAN